MLLLVNLENGKSSILDLISKNYEIESGEILLDNKNLNVLSKEFFDNNISVVLQEPFMFNTSIKENIKFANPNATDKEIIEVCKKADIHDFIMTKEDGYDTIIGENGVILSGGQKQRLAIARALIKKSKLILFDEATSALDNQSQATIINTLQELSKDHTVIIIAHRLSTIVNSDNIFVIKNHKIVDEGTHKYLFENCDIYTNLYKIEN